MIRFFILRVENITDKTLHLKLIFLLKEITIFTPSSETKTMYENFSQPILPFRKFRNRLLKNFFWSCLILLFSLVMGMIGYHYLEGLSWIDSLLDAAMILTGMGPIHSLTNDYAKIFATIYALYSGVAFLTVIAVFLAPVIHRFMHHFHFDDDN